MLPVVGSVLTSDSNSRSVIAPETVSDWRIGLRMRTSVPTTLYTTWPRLAAACAAVGATVGFGCDAAGAVVGAGVGAGAVVGAGAAGSEVGAAGGAAGPQASTTTSGSEMHTRNKRVTSTSPMSARSTTPPGGSLLGRGGGLFGRERFVDEHHRDAIANGVVSLARGTHQVVALAGDRLFVQWTGQDGQ